MAHRSHRPDGMAVLAEACQRAAESLKQTHDIASDKQGSQEIAETLMTGPTNSYVASARPVNSSTYNQPLVSLQDHSSNSLAIPANQRRLPSLNSADCFDMLNSGHSLMENWHCHPSPPLLLGPSLKSMTAQTVSPQSTANVGNNMTIDNIWCDEGYCEVPETMMQCEWFNNDQPLFETMVCLAHNVDVEDEEDGNEDLQKEKRCEWANCEHPPFPTMKAYVDHVTEHTTNEPDYLCKWRGCKRMKNQKAFKDRHTLVVHLLQHTGQKPWKCTFPGCNKAYTSAGNLKVHERKHRGERPYVCQIRRCGKAFTKASDLAMHENMSHVYVKSHHCPVEIQPNEQCTKSYTNPSSLYTHIVTSHNRKAYMIAKRKKSSNGFNGTCGIVRYEEWFGEVAQDEDANLENISSYQCPVEVSPNKQCTKSYNSAAGLSMHVKRSHSAKAWQIAKRRKTLVGRKASYRLVRHHEWFDEVADALDRAKRQSRTHSNIWTYHCPVEVCPNVRCRKSYNNCTSLRFHVITFHNMKAWQIAKEGKTIENYKALYHLIRHHEWFDEVSGARGSVNRGFLETVKAKRIYRYPKKPWASWISKHKQTHAQCDGPAEHDVSETHFTNCTQTRTEAGHFAGSLDPWIDSFHTPVSSGAVHDMTTPSNVPPPCTANSTIDKTPFVFLRNNSSDCLDVPAHQMSTPSLDYADQRGELNADHSQLQDWHWRPSPPLVSGPYPMPRTTTTVSPQSTDCVNNEDEEDYCEVLGTVRWDCKWRNCDQPIFETRESFVQHVNQHIDGSADYMCKWQGCYRVHRNVPFKQKYMLVLHVRRHTGEKPYKCTFPGCNKRYTRAENLKTHERWHTGERPYACEFNGCHRVFTNASDRSKHQQRTHSNVKAFHCPVEASPDTPCTKSYTDFSSLRKHIRTSHSAKAWKIVKRKKTLVGRKASYGLVLHHEWFDKVSDVQEESASERCQATVKVEQDVKAIHFMKSTHTLTEAGHLTCSSDPWVDSLQTTVSCAAVNGASIRMHQDISVCYGQTPRPPVWASETVQII